MEANTLTVEQIAEAFHVGIFDYGPADTRTSFFDLEPVPLGYGIDKDCTYLGVTIEVDQPWTTDNDGGAPASKVRVALIDDGDVTEIGTWTGWAINTLPDAISEMTRQCVIEVGRRARA